MTALPGPLPAGCSRETLLGAVRDAIADAGVAAGDVAILALSGGPDSTALAYLVSEAGPELDLTLVHVRHGLRDDTVDVDTVRRHAAWLGLPLEIREVDVTAQGRGLEDAARRARYAALAEVADEVGARWTFLGHHADDQAETVLLRAARGTGVSGLGAMAPVRGGLVRPLLRLRRGDLRRFVELEGLPVVDDPTNVDPAIRRAVVRHEVLGVLDRVAPDPVGALGRLAELSREDDAALGAWAAEVIGSACRRVAQVAAIPDTVLAGLPAAVARRVIRQLVLDLSSTTDPPSAATVARVLELRPGRMVHLPGGLRACAGGGWRAVYPAELPRASETVLQVPGCTPWGPAGLQLVASTPGADRDPSRRSARTQIAFDLPDAWTPPAVRLDDDAVPPGGHLDRLRLVLPASLPALTVRGRAPGDRIATRAGTQTLQDVFVDAGVPRPIRDLWPVVGCGDRIVWVPGIVADGALAAAGRHAPGVLLVCEGLRPPPKR